MPFRKNKRPPGCYTSGFQRPDCDGLIVKATEPFCALIIACAYSLSKSKNTLFQYESGLGLCRNTAPEGEWQSVPAKVQTVHGRASVAYSEPVKFGEHSGRDQHLCGSGPTTEIFHAEQSGSERIGLFNVRSNRAYMRYTEMFGSRQMNAILWILRAAVH